jgi:predicted nuclease of predicted toxin-antitoxin system
MMAGRFLADENLPRACVAAMRTAGYDVSWICEQTTALSDEDVCRMATDQDRVIVSNDKDFGDLVMRFRKAVPGVVLVRLHGKRPEEMATLLITALAQGHEWCGYFSVVSEDAIRIRPLPTRT